MITDLVWRENIIQGFIFFFCRIWKFLGLEVQVKGNFGMEMSDFFFAGGSSL